MHMPTKKTQKIQNDISFYCYSAEMLNKFQFNVSYNANKNAVIHKNADGNGFMV